MSNTTPADTFDLDQLQQRFGIPGVVRFEKGKGDLTRLSIAVPDASAELYLLGAQVTSFKPGGREALFVSSASNFAVGKAIRGGVPICFPYFGPHASRKDLPMHGFARLREWSVESVAQRDESTVEVVLRLEADAATREAWPIDFVIRHRVTVGRTLRMELEVNNRSQDVATFEAALHTYFAVDDVRKVEVTGLEATRYLDKLDRAEKAQQGPIRIVGETDRVYLDTRSATQIQNVSNGLSVHVGKENSDATVVWNPWVDKARSMPDFQDDEWPSMLCVETCNVGPHAIQLPSGQVHRMAATIDVSGDGPH